MPAELAHPDSAPAVLIVEDEFLIANGLQRVLEQGGYYVTGLAESVSEAQALVAAQTPTLVLLDIFLKGDQNGLDLAYWLRERGIPHIFLSANLTDSMLAAAKVTQPFGFLNKPYRERDVLAMLELAHYQAGQQTAVATQQQGLQLAVNEAISSLRDRDQLCLAIAGQVNRLVPFSLFALRTSRPDDDAPYWIVLRKTDTDQFERLPLPPALRRQLLAPAKAVEAPGLYTGAALTELCAHSPAARVSCETFGMQALALFAPVQQPRSATWLQLGCAEPNGFTTKDFETVQLLVPQIALALDNLLAGEEIEARSRVQAAGQAILQASQGVPDLPTIITAVATALSQLLPLEVLGINWSRPTASQLLPALTVQKTNGHFIVLPAGDGPEPPTEASELVAWQQRPGLYVGEALVALAATDALAQHYYEALGLRSLLVVPVSGPAQPPATLLVASQTPYVYTTRDLGTVQELSGQLALVLGNLVAATRIQQLSGQLGPAPAHPTGPDELPGLAGIVGGSAAMQRVLDNVARVAPTDYAVLVMGETGTGKELIARAVHRLSGRAAQPLIKVNCAALPAQLIESELFGHEKGAFTGATEQRIGKFELADKGTIFLDEVGELPLELQAKLLRVLQEGEIERLGGRGTRSVDVRVVAATNRDLHQEVLAGRFRADLYYRLYVFPVVVPPLRERPDDVLPLARHFLQQISTRLGRSFDGLTPAAQEQLRRYTWPGNVRELQHVLERAAILSLTTLVELAEPLREGLAVPGEAVRPARPLQDSLREAIVTALHQANYRIRGAGGAAELLDVKPTTLEARMRKLQIGATRPDGAGK